MRKSQKKQVEDFVRLLENAHDEIGRAIKNENIAAALELLGQCQEGAIKLGGLIETTEGEGFITVSLLEEYCELLYQLYREIEADKWEDIDKIRKKLRKIWIEIDNSVKRDIRVRLEIVFLPYKASMWDSLESVWMAADKDPDCDAYVVPIPYYDKNPDGSFGRYHYEGREFPSCVPVTYYEDYRLEERRPDVIYIHNPYDDINTVTSVDPRYYSDQLKENTEALVYIPYYATAGGMSEGQALCPAYLNADYIVIQAEKYRKFFDPRLPDSKFVALGSPKFDRVIRMCQNPPQPPEEWAEKMRGRKVYFYNTSIGGMLGDPDAFLKKMRYVFDTFKEHKDVCLLWRPHPLMESTFASMRKAFKPEYDALKEEFIRDGIGIYDRTPDIERTIALSDAYIGDAGTSVTSLFGIAGKPLFILNNQIHSLPEEDDWRGEIITRFSLTGQDAWVITQGNKLYHSPDNDYTYQYYCDLSEYSYGNYFAQAIEIGGKVYICPYNAQEILVVKNRKVEKRIELKRMLELGTAFAYAWNIGNSIFLIPNQYPAIVKYDVVQEKVDYIEGYHDIFVSNINGEKRVGGNCVWEKYLMIASPVDNRILAIDGYSGKVQVLSTGVKSARGCLMTIPDGMNIWLLPYEGKSIACWNPIEGKVREYSDVPSDFICRNRFYGYECEDKPFETIACCKSNIYIIPYFGNMFLQFDRDTGKMQEWKPPFPVLEKKKNGYYRSGAPGYFMYRTDSMGKWTYRYYSMYDSKLYDINLETQEYREINIDYDYEELFKHEPGFCEESEWLQYCCIENSFNTLKRFLKEKIVGEPFHRERQFIAFGKIIANYDGTSGREIHRFLCEKLSS